MFYHFFLSLLKGIWDFMMGNGSYRNTCHGKGAIWYQNVSTGREWESGGGHGLRPRYLALNVDFEVCSRRCQPPMAASEAHVQGFSRGMYGL